ncbi:MAG: crotonase/enoyl-CoA hydratase family protein [Alphaproteobacteria bacterium]|nr:crotonase/enoyl-CoA hydratase family protein [Alphaproteobacteria bacterium]
MSDFVTFDLTDRIATLTMDDGKANAFGLEMIAALCDGLDRAAAEASAVVITGRPGVLCAGFDLKIIRGNDDVAKLAMRTAGVEALLQTYMHPLPIIFACPGHAVAAGALLLLTGDVRIGTRGDYKIGLNEVGIGLSLPEFGLSLARDRLDPRVITQAILGARLYDAEEAAEVGYLDQAADAGVVMEIAQQTARDMLELDAQAFASTKQRLRQPTVDRIRASLAA